jgi:hypothetical protein
VDVRTAFLEQTVWLPVADPRLAIGQAVGFPAVYPYSSEVQLYDHDWLIRSNLFLSLASFVLREYLP